MIAGTRALLHRCYFPTCNSGTFSGEEASDWWPWPKHVLGAPGWWEKVGTIQALEGLLEKRQAWKVSFLDSNDFEAKANFAPPLSSRFLPSQGPRKHLEAWRSVHETTERLLFTGETSLFHALCPLSAPASPRPQLPGEALSLSCRKGRNWKAAEPGARAQRRRREEKLGDGRPSSGVAVAAREWNPCGCWSCTAAWGACTRRWEVRVHRAPPFPPGAARRSGSSEGRSGETPGAETLGGGEGGARLSWKQRLRAAASRCSVVETLLPAPNLRELSSWVPILQPGLWAILQGTPGAEGRAPGGADAQAQGASAERRGKRVPAPEVPVGRGGRWCGRVSLVTPDSRGSLRFPESRNSEPRERVPSHHREATPFVVHGV